jgi:hypothetical protein
VQGHLAAEIGIHHINPPSEKCFAAHQQMLSLGPAPQCDHRIVLKAQHDVTDATSLARLKQIALQRIGNAVPATPEPDAQCSRLAL